MKTTIDIHDQVLRILGDDGHLLDGFEMICEVIDDGSCHDVDQKANESCIGKQNAGDGKTCQQKQLRNALL